MSSDEPHRTPEPPGEHSQNSDRNGTAGKTGRPRRTGWRRLIPTWRMLLGTVLGLLLLLIGLFALGYALVDIPAANSAATAQSNVYLYADGTPIARDGDVNRENVPLSQVPRTVQHAVLAAEDRDFYSESAIDPKAMLRAAWNTVTGKGKQSGSTITQQYVKNYYLGQEQTVSRKVKEFFISIKLDREATKDEILEGYLNTSYFGRNAYGVQAAAQAYYGVDVQDLTTAQGAYLAALLNAPSAYDVVAHPENKGRAVARWNYVLDGMVKEKWLTPATRAATTFPTPDEAHNNQAGLSGQRGYLRDAVRDYIVDRKILDEDTLATGGYRITTTLQRAKQDAFVAAVDDQLMSKIDKKSRAADRNVRAGGTAVDPRTGKVLALYGGIDYTKQYVNNATRRDYQVGSTFKPFVFTSAVENGSTTQDGRVITPNTLYDGTDQRPVQGWDGGYYAPENEDSVDYGPLTVREATDKSVNAVYAQMAVDVGPGRVRQTAIDLGLPADTPDLTASPSIALGPATASVLDMAGAYATLAGHGRHTDYTLVTALSKDGESVTLPAPKGSRVVSRESADTTTAMLRSVVEDGTGTAAQAAGRPAAGKTGTAEEDTAAWFAGYTPDLATVVAVMGQDPDTAAHTPLYGAAGLPRINGGGFPAQIWAQFTRKALAGTPVHDFDLELEEGAEEPPEPPAADSQGPAGTAKPSAGTRTPGPSASKSGTRPSPTAPTAGATTGPGRGRDGGGDTGRGAPPAGRPREGVLSDLTSPSGRRSPPAAER
ncbi:penicillin-binding protein [Streptomyces sp. SID5785]|uniref:transglycosylase domain-containing protein n=1 Tax=Streptomyces sp. SID5785 TaxID=2690309 RepID=UPI001360CFA0|nr:transglycosylase domain-containing protein [Streptomyces sp. SID5785]MZD07869.1 penicillin-binding protein [Streptomyces sp. SID5785]